MDIKFDILDYLGKFNDGVFVLLSLSYGEYFYEATFYYTENMVVLTVDETLEKEIGTLIEDWPGYNDLMVSIIQKLVPYEEIVKTIGDLDISAMTEGTAGKVTLADYIDESEITSATQSV